MACPVTGNVLAHADGEHVKCPTCPHCLLCDHKRQTEKRHTHYHSMTRTVPTRYHGIVCESALCYCVKPDPFQERCRRQEKPTDGRQ